MHCLIQFSICQKALDAGVLLLQQSQSRGFVDLLTALLLLPAVAGRLGHIDGTANVGEGLAIGEQLFGDFELADDLASCM